MIDSLHLNIISVSCKCGNKWTHSHTWLASQAHGYLGGTPNPQQEEKLQYHSYSTHLWNVSGCFRCVPLQLGHNWTKPLRESFNEKPKPAPKPEPAPSPAPPSLLE